MSELTREQKELYPFLDKGNKGGANNREFLISSIKEKASSSAREKERFFQENSDAVLEAAELIAGVYRSGGRMFSMGNGGSSCDAAHFAVEFQHPVTAGRPSLPALNLGNDTAMITAVSNDLDFKHVFVRQLEAQARENDGLIGFSTSGNSDNLIEAFRKARELGLVTIGITGGDGGFMLKSENIDRCLVVRSDSIHRVQETHVAIYHILWDLVHTLLSYNRGKLGGGM